MSARPSACTSQSATGTSAKITATPPPSPPPGKTTPTLRIGCWHAEVTVHLSRKFSAVELRKQLAEVAEQIHLGQGGVRQAAEKLQHNLGAAQGIRGHHQGVPQIPAGELGQELLQKAADRERDREQAEHQQAAPQPAGQPREGAEGDPREVPEQRR